MKTMTDEELRKKMKPLMGRRRALDLEGLKLWRKWAPLRVITCWRAEGGSGLSLPTIAYLSDTSMLEVKRCFKALKGLVASNYCGETGHVIYYPSLESNYRFNPRTGAYTYSDYSNYRRASSWGFGYPHRREQDLFKKGIYPTQRRLNKMEEEEVRQLCVPDARKSVVAKRRWARLKRAAALEG